MTEVAEGTPNTGVAPLAVLGGHPDDEPADRVHDPWAARSATAAAVVCPRDQLSMPAEEGIGRDQGEQVTEYPSPEALGLCGQARRWCADAGRPTRFKPSSPSPPDAVRDGSAKLGPPVQNVTREHGLTPLPR